MMQNEAFKLVTKPNCSLTKQGRLYAVIIIAVISFIIAAFFCFFGAWMVLPFTGLECLAVAAAFYYMQCHAKDYESISIANDDLTIERLSYKSFTQISFNRYWAKIYLYDLPNGKHELRIRSHGKEVCFGNRYMDDDQRIKLAKELNQMVGLAY